MSNTRPGVSAYAMPSLGADMDEGAVVEWLVDVGDTVERGQVVARVETEKSDIDIEIWQEGVVAEIVVGPNRTVPVGTTLMRLHATGADAAVTETEVSLVTPERTVVRDGVPESDVVVPSHHGRRDEVWATPLARRLAGAQGIALSGLSGSGPHGAVRSRDLPAPSSRTLPPPTGSEPAGPEPSRAEFRTDRMRSMIAERMTRSNSDIPHYRLQQDIDLGPLFARLSSLNEARPISERVVVAAALVRAVTIAAQRHPELNGTWVDGCFHPGLGINVSVAISLRGGGLVTPTIHQADTKTLDEVMALLRAFTTAARSGTLRSEWTAGGSSITVTNLGERGADLVHGLISPPEVALVGFGRITERAVVIDGAVVARPVVMATLGADHRATDGAVGSRFLSTLASALEDPEQL